MKTQFIHRMLSQVWNMDQMRARQFLGDVVARLNNERPKEDVDGFPLPTMQILGDVAVIPVVGVLQIGVPDWVKEWGLWLTDANDIAEEIRKAESEGVKGIVFHVDSPGGASIASDKLFEAVEQVTRRIPTIGFIDDGAEACSAAFHTIAPCTGIYCGRHAAAIGCIGSYIAYLNDVEYWAKLGIVFEVFRSGELKGIGIDALSEERRAYLQQMADEAGAGFRKGVKKYRTGIADEDMDGRWFTGIPAAQRGFVTGHVRDLAGAIAKVRSLAAG